MNKLAERIFYLSLSTLTFLIIWGALIYWTFSFNLAGKIAIVLLTIISTVILFKKINKNFGSTEKQSQSNNYLVSAIWLLFFIGAVFFLFRAQSSQALISPWEQVNSWFFLIYGGLTLLTVHLTYNRTKLSQLITSLFYLLSFSVALIVYKIGYGFDPFIHQATAQIIDQLGQIQPKPFYYIGQYSLIIIFNNILGISIEMLDKLLVPVLAAIFLPISFRLFWQRYFPQDRALTITTLLLLLPFSIFIITTPQNLAFLLLIISLFLNLTLRSKYLLLSSLISLATLFVHPIAGIPAILITMAGWLYSRRNKLNPKLTKLSFTGIFLAAVIALPAAFLMLNKDGLNWGNFNLNIFSSLSWAYQESLWLNFNYFYNFNISLIILGLIIAGIFLWRYHYKTPKIFILPLLFSLAFFISYLLSQLLSFAFLIDYERDYYRQRILVLSIIMSLPFIALTFKYLLSKIQKQKIIWLILISLIITASLYNSYPRYDHYFNSHGYSLSQQDADTVEFIQSIAEDNNYLVLSNQQVSVAALREFGFSRYLANDLYFYPIPTSGPLYKYYLQMVYEYPNQKTMQKAMTLAQVDTGYLVINKYWWAAKKIIDEAKLEANDYYKLFNGEVFVFIYK